MNISINDQHATVTDSPGSANRPAIPDADAIPLRVRDVAALRGLGYSYQLIGKQFGISAQAVSLMLSRYRRRLDSLGDAIELQSLSCRAANALGRYGITSREEARQKRIVELLRHEKNCGHKTVQEIERWMRAESAKAA